MELKFQLFENKYLLESTSKSKQPCKIRIITNDRTTTNKPYNYPCLGYLKAIFKILVSSRYSSWYWNLLGDINLDVVELRGETILLKYRMWHFKEGRRSMVFLVRKIWVWIPTQRYTSYLALDKLANLPGLSFFICKMKLVLHWNCKRLNEISYIST